MKRLAARWASRVRSVLLPIAKRIAKDESVRTDEEVESDEAEAIGSALDSISSATYAESTDFASSMKSTADKSVRNSKAEFKRLGIRLRDTEPKLDSAIKGWRATNVKLVTTMLDREKERLSEILTNGEGLRYESLAKQIQERCDITSRHAEFIARDQTLKLNANISHARMASAGITQFVWTCAQDERVRPRHLELDGQTFDFSDPPETNDDGDVNLPGEDYQCLPGDTKVALTSRIRRAYRRRYNGKLTELITDSGVALKCTPNHPVLTASGWKAAEAVQVGDYVFDVRKQRFDFSKVNVEKREASIADLFSALSVLWLTKRRVGVASQFHGDGTDEQVDIVDVEWELLFHGEPTRTENFRKFLLAVPDAEASAGGALEQSLSALGFPADSDMRRFCYRLTLLETRIRESNQVGLAAATQSNAVALQEVTNGLALDAVAVAERFDRGALSVQAEALLLREWLCVRWGSVLAKSSNPSSAESLGQAVGVQGQSLADLGKQSPVFEHPLRVVEKRISELPFNGHVYNLETDDGWYAASIAVRNCRCVAFPIVPELDSADDEDDDTAQAAE